MTRDVLLKKLCSRDRINGCCNGTRDYQCYDCAQLMNEWLDKYDKQIRAEAIDDFVKACENNQLFPMYGGYVYMTDIKEIAEKLKAGVKMGDLISRSELIENFRKCYSGHLGMENSDACMTFHGICNVINNTNTVYDVDKVVEELELHSFELGTDTPPAHYVRLNEAIEIVKAGAMK